MPKYLIKQVVEAVKWTEGPCPRCGWNYSVAWDDGKLFVCESCEMQHGDYIVTWNDDSKEVMHAYNFERRFDQLKEDADTDYCRWCSGTGLNGGEENFE